MSSPHSIKVGVCRHGNCVKAGKGTPPLCPEHTPSKTPKTELPWVVPMNKLMSGKA